MTRLELIDEFKMSKKWEVSGDAMHLRADSKDNRFSVEFHPNVLSVYDMMDDPITLRFPYSAIEKNNPTWLSIKSLLL